MLTISDLLDELEEEAEATRRVLERVPDAQLDWRPHQKSMTLGELAMHIASIPGAIAEVSTQDFDVKTVIPRPGVRNSAELLFTLEASLRQAKTLLGAMNDADLSLPWRMVDDDQEVVVFSRGQLLRSVMLNHWYHHRGQLTVYLRQIGVPLPSIYGGSADEDPFTTRSGINAETS
jgi:uncharacterized damage-inducible protein DinB